MPVLDVSVLSKQILFFLFKGPVAVSCVELEIAHCIQQEEPGCCLVLIYHPNPEELRFFFLENGHEFCAFCLDVCAHCVSHL